MKHVRGVLVVLVLAAGACLRGASVPRGTQPLPPKGVVGPPLQTSGGVPSLHLVLDDPRVAKAREFERAKDSASALRAFREARATNLSEEEQCAWDYVEGRLALAANVPLDALASFERARNAMCPLAPHATVRAAQAAVRAGRLDDAISRASACPDDVGLKEEAKLVLAEALSLKNDRAAALPLWQAWLRQNPHGNRWVDTSVRIANALLDGEAGPAELHAREAYELATKVVVEAPKLADAAGAVAARLRAVAVGRRNDPSLSEALSDAERAQQAQAWCDAGDSKKCTEIASVVLAKAKTGAAACRAAITRANALPSSRGAKLNGWSDAVAACDKDPDQVKALYSGAKAHAGKEPQTAIEWFARIEKAFPTHRLADDARYRAALLVAQGSDEGHEARAEEMLRSLGDAYPGGDMAPEALFHVALDKMRRGDWEAAKPLLDQIIALTPEDRHWATAGRAEYFRARAAAATSDARGATERYVRVIERHPLSFYMVLAYARLASDDSAHASRVMKDAAAREGTDTFPSREHPILRSKAIARAIRLLEVSDVEAARREIAASGALAEDVDPEVVWVIGALYNQAGLPETGHQFSRGRLTDFLAHYPHGKWRKPWEIAYPRAYDAVVVNACAQNALPTPLAWGIMREESSFVVDVRSHSNAIGLMQLIVPTAKWISAGTTFPCDEPSLKRPEVSVGLGTRLLSKLRTTHGHPALAIAAYNAGGGAVERWVAARTTDELDLFVELVPYDETRNYVKRVLSSQAAYSYLYESSTDLREPFGLQLRLGR